MAIIISIEQARSARRAKTTSNRKQPASSRRTVLRAVGSAPALTSAQRQRRDEVRLAAKARL
ncbi:hypothetical protein SNE35_18725 [Paucibacter sp. R3-3]|uniref:Uncharacterized protein n=1 Tax=Roseateles agri TaxID=3098619 RepID=A0ABU5DJT1_9BURK|nr:hypothetical protein [Paucibacter sp. R3-3]MDY0746555.1 hypothetical protein [Paucibacter sp. R3-3]